MRARRSELLNYGLIGVAVAVAGYALVLDKGKATTSEQLARAGMLLHVFRADDVTRVSIDRDGEHVDLVREADTWQMTAPRVARADFLAVTSLLNALAGARAERAVGAPTAADRHAFGLDAPRAQLDVAMKGVELKIALGGEAAGDTPDGGAKTAYVEVAPYGDDKGGVFVVSADVARALDRGADAYRSPSLLDSKISLAFQRIHVTSRDGGELRLERAAHATWRLVSSATPTPVRADIDVVDGLLIALNDLKADPFVVDTTAVDPARGGTVEIEERDGAKLTVVFGGPCPTDPKLVVAQARTPDRLTGCVSSLTTDRLGLPADRYVDGHPFGLLYGTESAKISEIEAVTIERSGHVILDAERVGDGLHLRAPADDRADRDHTERFFHRLASVHGVVMPAPAPERLAALGLSPPTGRVVLRRRVDPVTMGGPAPDGGADEWDQTIEVGALVVDDEKAKSPRKVVWIHRLDDGAYLQLSAEDAQPLGPSSVMELRTANLVDVEAAAIERVAVRSTLAGAFPYELERSGSSFKLVSPPLLGADAGAASELTKELATLTCMRWAAERDDGSFGFAAPIAIVDLRRTVAATDVDGGAPASPDLELEVGASTADGGYYARVKGRDPICVLGQAKIESLVRVPVDRAAPAFDPTDTPRIVATHAQSVRIAAFDASARSWADGADGGAPNDVAARDLADRAVSLRAEGLVHPGAEAKDEGLEAPTLVIEGFDLAGKRKRRVVIGAIGRLGAAVVYYARVDGIDATYGILREDVDRILKGM